MIRRIVVYGAAAALMGIAALALWVMSRPRPEPEGPLAVAAAQGSPAEVQEAIDQGAPADALDSHGYTPLVWASRAGHGEAIAALVAAGADPDRQDEAVNGWTPLLHAVHKDQLRAVRTLLAAGADVNRPSPSGLTPLMLAAGQGNAEMVEALLEAGADPRGEADGRSVLSQAILGNNPRIVEALLREAPDLRLGDRWQDRLVRGFAWLRGRSELIARLDQAKRSIR